MGQFKRTIRSWKNEIQNKWMCIRTFYRIVLAIILAMAAVYMTRKILLDPLQTELNNKNEKMDEKDIPHVVPPAAEDDEIQKLEMTLESLLKNTEKWQREEEFAVSRRPQINLKNFSEVITEFESLIGKSGMMLQSKSGWRESENDNQNYPLSVRICMYELGGTFQSVYNYLKQVRNFRYPARIREIKIIVEKNKAIITDNRGNKIIVERNTAIRTDDSKNEPLILLSFNLEFYYHEK